MVLKSIDAKLRKYKRWSLWANQIMSQRQVWRCKGKDEGTESHMKHPNVTQITSNLQPHNSPHPSCRKGPHGYCFCSSEPSSSEWQFHAPRLMSPMQLDRDAKIEESLLWRKCANDLVDGKLVEKWYSINGYKWHLSSGRPHCSTSRYQDKILRQYRTNRDMTCCLEDFEDIFFLTASRLTPQHDIASPKHNMTSVLTSAAITHNASESAMRKGEKMRKRRYCSWSDGVANLSGGRWSQPGKNWNKNISRI